MFFVLRKKDKQITFLHMYHHTAMPMVSWGCTKYYPGGHGTLIGVINSFVHIIMYFYYMMSAMGPQYHKYLWWKKYITTLQMVRHCAVYFSRFVRHNYVTISTVIEVAFLALCNNSVKAEQRTDKWDFEDYWRREFITALE